MGYDVGGSSGSGNTDYKRVPTALDTTGVMANKKVKDISRGDGVGCAITTDGLGYCWGDNTYGTLGDGTNSASYSPVAIYMGGALSGKTLKKVVVGQTVACAIASDDKPYCWGNNSSGQLGNGNFTNSNAPVAVDTSGVLSGKTVTDIQIGDGVACALTSDFGQYCWGDRGFGILGHQSLTYTNTPVSIHMTGALSGKTLKKMAFHHQGNGGSGFTCSIASDDLPYCWGYNAAGQLGNNSTTNSNVPVAVSTAGVLSGKTIKDIDVGYAHACVLTTDNEIACWGDNAEYQTGDTTSTNELVPVLKTKSGLLTGKTFQKIELENNNTCVLTGDDEWICWGTHSNYTATPNYLYPELLLIDPFKNDKLSIHQDNACAIDNNKDLHCWGWNAFSAIGDGTTVDSNLPILISPTTPKYSKVAVGAEHACAITTAGEIKCWGNNNVGQLGTGDTTSSSTPVSVNFSAVGAYYAEAISVSTGYSCAIVRYNVLSNKKVFCWGLNTYGQIGDFSQTTRNSPTLIYESGELNGGYNPMQIVTAKETTCMIAKLTANVRPLPYCWGRNNTTMGLLGRNDSASAIITHPQAVYVAGVLANRAIRQIAGNTSDAGTFCVITDDYNVYCWGSGGNGQLGNNTWTQSIVPTSPDTTGVLSGKKIKSVSTGNAHVCALSTTNTIHCWGRGEQGQLGDGLNTAYATPVNMTMSGNLNGKEIFNIILGQSNSCALTKDNQVYCSGYNYSGQFGIGDYNQYSVPTRAMNTLNFDF